MKRNTSMYCRGLASFKWFTFSWGISFHITSSWSLRGMGGVDNLCRLCHYRRVDNYVDVDKLGAVTNVNNVDNVKKVEIPTIKVLIAFRKRPYSRNKNLRKVMVLNALSM
jgi:hypothetical protein